VSDYESMVLDQRTGEWYLPSSRANGHAKEPTPIRRTAQTETSPKPKETREQIVSRLRLARISPQEIAALTEMHGAEIVAEVLNKPILPPPSSPMGVARKLAERHDHRGKLTLRHWRGGWWTWRGSHWSEREERAVRAEAYALTEKAEYLDPEKALQPWQPTRFKIGNLLEAMAAIVHLDETTDQPSWIAAAGPPVVAVANGLLRLDGRELLPHSPSYFNSTAVPFAYDPEAPSPAAWLAFLSELWPGDPDSIAALQEYMGYVVSGRLDYHKILLIVGPTRGGKGTIARILGKLIGPANVAGPTLSSLSHDFGMAPLIGKGLAVISDARLDASRDSSVVVERLLAISGEDTITVNRKYREQWTGKLSTRFLIISNELPRLGDASATIANRFVVLLLRESWLNREDHALEDRLSAELSGILNWALDGLDRLVAQDRFTRPASTDEAITALQDLASPVAAFVREQCVTGPTHEVPIDVVFGAWKAWAEVNGNRSGNVQTFGRNLRAVVPGMRAGRPRDGEDRVRVYRGIGLRDATGHSDADRGPLRTTDDDDEAPVRDGPRSNALWAVGDNDLATESPV
jgi:putative DNA primase/helicase